MAKYHRISYEDWEDQQQCMSQMSSAIFGLLYQLKVHNLSGCMEALHGEAAIERWRQLNLSSIERLESELANAERRAK